MKLRWCVLGSFITSGLVLGGCSQVADPSVEQVPRVNIEKVPVTQLSVRSLNDEMPSEYTDEKGTHWVGGPFDVNEKVDTSKVSELNLIPAGKLLSELDDAAYAEATRPMRVVLRDGHVPMRYLGSARPVEQIARERRRDRTGGRGYTEWGGGPMHELPPVGLDSTDPFTTSLRVSLDPSETPRTWANDPTQFGIAVDQTQTLANIITADGDNRRWFVTPRHAPS